jgi:hypothetical protein
MHADRRELVGYDAKGSVAGDGQRCIPLANTSTIAPLKPQPLATHPGTGIAQTQTNTPAIAIHLLRPMISRSRNGLAMVDRAG